MRLRLSNIAIIEKFASNCFRQTLLLLYVSYIILSKAHFIFAPFYSKKILLGLLIVAFAIYPKTRGFLFLISVTVTLLFLQLITKFAFVANHAFVCFFVGIILLVSFLQKDYFSNMKFQATFLLVFIMMVAVVQKFLSESFMSGEYLNLSFCKGSFFEWLLWIDSYKEMVDKNFQAYKELQLFNNHSPITLHTLIPHQLWWAKLFSWLVIAAELFFVVALFLKNIFWRNFFLLLIIFSIALTRKEIGFAALLIMLVAMTLPAQQVKSRMFYSVLFITATLLVLLGIGVP